MKKKRYILFGTGDYYQRYKSWIDVCDVVALLDNSVSKQGKIIDGHLVVAPDKVNEFKYDAVVIMSFSYMEMRTQLLELGVEPERIYSFFDLHDLLLMKKMVSKEKETAKVLLLAHDLSLGGPSLALFKTAKILKKNCFDVFVGSMQEGPLLAEIIKCNIPVIIDKRLQICTMDELPWTWKYDLIICNTINYNVFVSKRNLSVPVMWWLHDARRYYDGVSPERLRNLDQSNLKIVTVGPVPRKAIREYLPDVEVNELLYGVDVNG